jgi:hypothetical protein
VGALEGRDEPLAAHREPQRLDDLRVGRRLEANPPALVKVGQDGADADVVEAGRHRVRIVHEAFLVLEKDALVALRDTRRALATGEARRVLARVDPLAARFHAHQLDRRVVEEPGEDAGGVRAAPHARVDSPREAARRREHLRARLLPDDRLEVRHHPRERMRAAHGAQDVVRVGHRVRPVAQARVDRVLQRPRAGGDGDHLGAELLHPEDVRPLAGDILLAHVDRAREPEPRRHRRRGHAVLPGAGLGDHPPLPHAPDEQALAHDVVGLVGAGVIQLLALDVDSRAAEPAREVVAVRHGRRAAGVGRHHLDVGLPERGIAPRLVEGRA